MGLAVIVVEPDDRHTLAAQELDLALVRGVFSAEADGDASTPGIEVARRHKPVAPIVARSNEHDDRHPDEVPHMAANVVRNRKARVLHQHVLGDAANLGAVLDLAHLLGRNDLHGSLVEQVRFLSVQRGSGRIRRRHLHDPVAALDHVRDGIPPLEVVRHRAVGLPRRVVLVDLVEVGKVGVFPVLQYVEPETAGLVTDGTRASPRLASTNSSITPGLTLIVTKMAIILTPLKYPESGRQRFPDPICLMMRGRHVTPDAGTKCIRLGALAATALTPSAFCARGQSDIF